MIAKRLGAVVLTVCLVSLILTGVADAQGHGRLIGRSRVTVARGGEVAAAGWRLYVPPGTVNRDGAATITAEGGGRVDLHIDAPWHGRVRVSAPFHAGAEEEIAHRVGGLWMPEGKQVGESVVWVHHLSLFSLATGIYDAVKDGLCLTSFDPLDFAGCVALNGIQYLDQQAALYLVSKVSKSCIAALTTSAAYVASTGQIPVAAVKAVLGDSACTGSAGGGGSSPAPASPSPAPPAATSPAPTPPTSAPPPASGGAHPVFGVQNTSETLPDGVWFRNSPESADTDRVTGHGIYMGEQVQLICYGWGEAVGPYTDSLWYYVVNVTRPTNDGVSNSGWLNAHYIADSKYADEVDPGVEACH